MIQHSNVQGSCKKAVRCGPQTSSKLINFLFTYLFIMQHATFDRSRTQCSGSGEFATLAAKNGKIAKIWEMPV
jgi:hypothetical protein